MHARNLPLYQSGEAWPVSARGAGAAPVQAFEGVVAAVRARRRSNPMRFWLLVALVVVAAGLTAWFVL